jgi:hypothetical protein
MIANRIGLTACLAVSGYLHADLYANGYRAIPYIGPSFLWQASASFAVALLVLVANPVVLRFAAAALSAGALGAYALSRTTGLFGFTERGWQPAPQALIAVLAEVSALVLLAAPVLLSRSRQRL